MSRRRARAPSAASPIVAMAERALELGATRAVLVYVVPVPGCPGGERRAVSLPDMGALETAGLLSLAVADLAAGAMELEGAAADG